MFDILMSTYNGARFLRAQIDSILDQDRREIRLLVRDDGSTDETAAIVRDYSEKDPRVVLVEDSHGNLRAFASFMKLVEFSDAPYFLFADQDDVWDRDHVSILEAKIREMEDSHGTETPIVAFSDLTVADEELNVIDRSLWRYQQFDPNTCRNWKHLLAQNVVLGCGMIANAAARKISLPYRLPGMAHDQWLAVNAAKHGQIDFVRRSTLLYRQHRGNHSGANKFNLAFALERLPDLYTRAREYRKFVKVFDTASTAELLFYKMWLNLHRFNRREEF